MIPSALKNYLKDKGIGDTVNLQVERDGKVLTLAVTLGSSASKNNIETGMQTEICIPVFCLNDFPLGEAVNGPAR